MTRTPSPARSPDCHLARTSGWAALLGVLLWPEAALAAGAGSSQWVGAGIALALFLLVVVVAGWALRRSSSDTSAERPALTPAPPSPTVPVQPSAPAPNRLGRLRTGISQRRSALREGEPGFLGDTEVMSRFLQGCGRLERGEAPPSAPGRQLPPGTLPRLVGLYEQLLKATPARARDWTLQRSKVALQIRGALSPRDADRFLELIDGLAKRRSEREQPTPSEAADWRAFLLQFNGSHFQVATDPNAVPSAPASSGLERQLPEDAPTEDANRLAPALPFEEDAPTTNTERLSVQLAEDAPTLDTEHLFSTSPATTLSTEEDAPTMDTDHLFAGSGSDVAHTIVAERLFPASSDPSALAEDTPTIDTGHLFSEPPALATEEDVPTMDTGHLFSEPPALAPEEDAPTMDTGRLFSEPPSLAPEEDAPTMDTGRLFSEPPDLALEEGTVRVVPQGRKPGSGIPATMEGDAPTLNTDHLFRGEPKDAEDDDPTIDTLKLFQPAPKPTPRRQRGGAPPSRESFTETDELLDPVDDAPTRDTADLFRNE